MGVAEHSMSPVHWRPELDEHVFKSLENVIVVHFSWPSTMEQVVHESGVAEHSVSSSHRRPELDEHVSESFQIVSVVHFSWTPTMEQAVHELGVDEHLISLTHRRPEPDAHIHGSFERVIVSHSGWPSTMEQAVHESRVVEHERLPLHCKYSVEQSALLSEKDEVTEQELSPTIARTPIKPTINLMVGIGLVSKTDSH